MVQYFAIVEKDDDSAFGVTFPDIEGCFSAADKLEDVLPNALEALSLYAEDAKLPKASSLETLRRRKNVREALLAGGFLLAVPVIENEARIVRANITMEAGLLRAIDEAASSRKLTRSAFLAQAARRIIESRSKN